MTVQSLLLQLVLFLVLGLTIVGVCGLAWAWLERLGIRPDLENAERKPRQDAVVTGAAYTIIICLAFMLRRRQQ